MTRRIAFIICGLFAFTIASLCFAQAKDQHILVDDLDIYYGVLPAKLAQRGHKSGKQRDELHDKKHLAKASHHLVVALFDHGSGKRITDASITATVTPLGLGPQKKTLEKMKIGDTETYGNYFSMPATDPYKIRLDITLLGHSRPFTATFEYRHPQ